MSVGTLTHIYLLKTISLMGVDLQIFLDLEQKLSVFIYHYG